MTDDEEASKSLENGAISTFLEYAKLDKNEVLILKAIDVYMMRLWGMFKRDQKKSEKYEEEYIDFTRLTTMLHATKYKDEE